MMDEIDEARVAEHRRRIGARLPALLARKERRAALTGRRAADAGEPERPGTEIPPRALRPGNSETLP